METKKYVRRPFYVEAVQVTRENMPDVAEWADGEIVVPEVSTDNPYILIETKRPLNERQRRAFIGDYVLKSQSGWMIFTVYSFLKQFVEDKESDQLELEFDFSKIEPKKLEKLPEQIVRDWQPATHIGNESERVNGITIEIKSLISDGQVERAYKILDMLTVRTRNLVEAGLLYEERHVLTGYRA